MPEELLEQIALQGFNVILDLMRIVINEAMKAERSNYLGVAPYERSVDRHGYANGYKPKIVKTRLGEITFVVPQVRDGSFYPGALQKRPEKRKGLDDCPGRFASPGVGGLRLFDLAKLEETPMRLI